MSKTGQSLLGCTSLLAVISAIATTEPLMAQTVAAPPVRQPVDENGVDLSSGTFNVTSTDVTIGPAALGMSYVRVGNGAGWRDNLTGALNFDGARMTASIGDTSETFTYSGGVYTSDQGSGATFTYNWAAHEYTYTTRDGTVAIFAEAQGTYGRYGNAGYLQKITRPNGTIWTFTNVTGQWCPLGYWNGSSCTTALTTSARVQSVTNNAGYQLKLEYASNSLTDYNSLDAWYRVAKVTGINNAVEYCDPAATSCSVASTWPRATYSRTGNVETVTDASGAQATITYDGSNRIVSVKRPTAASASTSIGYGVDGKVSTVTNEGVSFTYSWSDGSNIRTLSRNSALGSHLRVDSHIPSNFVTSVYFGLTEQGQSRSTSYSYDTSFRLKGVYQYEGNSVQYTYDARGNVTEARQVSKTPGTPADIVTSAYFDPSCSNPKVCNQPQWTRDAKGNQTDYQYDPSHGGVLSVTAPASTSGANRPQTRFSYAPLQAYYKNASGAIVASGSSIYVPTQSSTCQTLTSCVGTADEARMTVSYGAQQAGTPNNLNPVTMTNAAGNGSLSATTTLAYDSVGNLSTVDGPLPGSDDITRIIYDANRRQIGVISAAPHVGHANLAQRITYNADGAVTQVEKGTTNGQSDAAFAAFSSLQRLETSYDTNGRKSKEVVKGSDGVAVSVVQYGYDTLGRQECTALRMNPAAFSSLPTSACSLGAAGTAGPDRITKTAYNSGNAVTSVITGYGTAGQTTSVKYVYTPNGLVAALVDANTNRTTYEYDGFDRLVKTRFPVAGIGADASSTTDYEQYGYDPNGNVISRRTRAGETLGFGYDNLDRMISKVVPERTGLSSTHTRDVYYGYDLMGRPTHARFDSASGEGVVYASDALGRVTSETSTMDGVSRTITSTRLENGARSLMYYPDGQYIQYNRNALGGLYYIQAGSNPLYYPPYNPDGSVNAAYRWQPSVGWNYGNGYTGFAHDPAGRVSSITTGLAGTSYDTATTFTYNPASQTSTNTRSNDSYAWTGAVDADRPYTANSLNQYASVAGVAFAYDSNGNLTSDGGNAYTYDVENRLVGRTGGGSASLRYDPLGRLYEVTGAGGTTRFLHDGSDLVAEFDAAGNLLRRYVHGTAAGGDDVLVWYEGAGLADSARRDLYSDERGSIVAVADANGNALAINRYDSFGIPAAGNQGRFQYTGQAWLPELGMYYYKARMYSPTLGRFMQTDPIGYSDGMNWYDYVGGDPINGRDPSGLSGDRRDPDVLPIDPSVADALREGDGLLVVGARDPFTLSEQMNMQSRPAPVDRELRSVDFADNSGQSPSVTDEIVVTAKRVKRTTTRVGYRIKGILSIPFVVLHDLAFPAACGAAMDGSPCSLAEQLAIESARGNVRARRIMQGQINDPNYPESDWGKFQYVHHRLFGRNITVHFWRNLHTGSEHGYKIVP